MPGSQVDDAHKGCARRDGGVPEGEVSRCQPLGGELGVLTKNLCLRVAAGGKLQKELHAQSCAPDAGLAAEHAGISDDQAFSHALSSLPRRAQTHEAGTRRRIEPFMPRGPEGFRNGDEKQCAVQYALLAISEAANRPAGGGADTRVGDPLGPSTRRAVRAQLMGHANVDTALNVYTQVLHGSLRDAVDRVVSELFTIVHKTGKENSGIAA